MSFKRGEIITHHGTSSGYWMVMEINHKEIKLSPIFGYDKILYFDYKRKWFDDQGYKKHNSSGLPPIIQARYDHEVMRRRKKL